MQFIENEFLRVGVNDLLGGSLTSIFDKKANEELLYQPVEGSWSGQDVVIFPFVARLNGPYTVNGKEYSMKNHGLARYHSFEVLTHKANGITLRFSYDEKTLEQYPYEFVLTVEYVLEKNSLQVRYTVYNPGLKPLFFGLGGHPALRIDEDEKGDIQGNSVLFKEGTKVRQMELDPTFSFVIAEKEEKPLEKIDLSRSLFQKEGTLMFHVDDSVNRATLIRKNGRRISYEFQSINYLAVWSNQSKGDYVCIEPWTSLPDYLECEKELEKKKTILGLSSKCTYAMSYKMIF